MLYFFYCDPPYFNAECYEVAFPKPDHIRLHDALVKCKGLVMVAELRGPAQEQVDSAAQGGMEMR